MDGDLMIVSGEPPSMEYASGIGFRLYRRSTNHLPSFEQAGNISLTPKVRRFRFVPFESTRQKLASPA